MEKKESLLMGVGANGSALSLFAWHFTGKLPSGLHDT